MGWDGGQRQRDKGIYEDEKRGENEGRKLKMKDLKEEKEKRKELRQG